MNLNLIMKCQTLKRLPYLAKAEGWRLFQDPLAEERELPTPHLEVLGLLVGVGDGCRTY